MTLRIGRQPRFEPLRSATPPCEAQNAAQSLARWYSFRCRHRSSSGCRLTAGLVATFCDYQDLASSPLAGED